jgi:hypothetical protein
VGVGPLLPVRTAGASPPETVSEMLEGLPAARGLSVAGRASQPVKAPFPFSMVGFLLPRRDVAQFRTSMDGQTWTPWTSIALMPPDEGPDPDGAEGGTDGELWSHPVWVGAAGWLEVRGTDVSRLRVSLIDSAGLSQPLSARARGVLWDALALAGGTGIAEAASKPRIYTRAEWGANESWRGGGPWYATQADYAVIHHTAGTNSYSQDDVPAIIRGVYRFHTQSRGWSDIAYNFLLDKWGRVFEGRFGGMDRPVVGAHAAFHNNGSIGVAALGCYHSSCNGDTTVRRSMLDGVDALLGWKFAHHGIDPNGTTRASSGRIPNVVGHRDVRSTACPGDRLYAYVRGVERMADRVAAFIPGPLPRLSGSNRVATAVVISKWAFTSSGHVVIASSEAFPDGLAAGPLAGSLGAPVLLSPAGSLPGVVADEIKRLGATRAWLVGGTTRLSEQVEADLVAKAGITGSQIVRIAGGDRFETAAQVAATVVGREEPDAAILALGTDFADALSASALGAAYRLPVLLVGRNSLPLATQSFRQQRSENQKLGE